MKHSIVLVGALIAGIAATATAYGLARNSNEPAALASAVVSTASDAVPHVDQKFTVDTVHSSVMFRIEHMGVTNFYGAFKDITGSYSFGDNASFDITVKTESVDTRNEGRDRHLRSPDFFNAAEFPTLTFKSNKVEKDGDGLKVTGDLSLHGVTKPITVTMRVWPAKETRQGVKSGFETSFSIKRSDFGMNTYLAEGGLGDQVDIVVAVEGNAAR